MGSNPLFGHSHVSLGCDNIFHPRELSDVLLLGIHLIKVGSIDDKLKIAKKFKENIEKLNNFK